VGKKIENYFSNLRNVGFKTKEGDRETQLSQLAVQIEKNHEKLRKIESKFAMDDLDRAAYDRVRRPELEEERSLKERHSQLQLTDTNFMKYCKYGISLLSNLDVCYQEAIPSVQKKLLGSIFTGKLIFEGGNYRTTGLNRAVELIGLFQRGLGSKKEGRFDISGKTSGDVPFTELTSNQFTEGMKKIYDLEPLINAQKLDRLSFDKRDTRAMGTG